MNEQLLLYLILEFEKDFKYFIQQNLIDLYTEELVLGRFENIVKIKRNSRPENKNKNSIDLLTLGELSELFSDNIDRLNPDIQSYGKSIRNYLDSMTNYRNYLAHPNLSPDDEADQMSIRKLTLYTAVADITKNINFDWKNTLEAINFLDDSKNFAFIEDEISKIKFGANNNLPNTNHKDTDFIGRKEELKKLDDLIKNKRINLISICGSGGLGKTSLALEYCHNLIDSESELFNQIIFFSFKEDELLFDIDEKYETTFLGFLKMLNEDFDIYSEGLDDAISQIDSEDSLIILDNTESLSKDEILNFYYKFQNAKFLLTSRIGLGEVETRIDLKAMPLNESKYLLRKSANLLGVNIDLFANEEKLNDLVFELGTPLGIKWGLHKISEGTTVEDLINNKNELIEFCTSGVFDSLLDNDLEVLVIIKESIDPITTGEISYYTNSTLDEVGTSIIELDKRSLLTKKVDKRKIVETYTVVAQVHDYINQNKDKFKKILSKLIQSKRQDTLENQMDAADLLKSQFVPNRLYITNNQSKIAAKFLRDALFQKSMNKIAIENIEQAKTIAPNYFENFRVSAFLKSKSSLSNDALEDYQRALNLAENEEHKAWVSFWYSGYLIRDFSETSTDEFLLAKELAENSHEYYSNQSTAYNLAFILTVLQQFDEAKKVIFKTGISLLDNKKFWDRESRKSLTLLIEISRREYLDIPERSTDVSLQLASIFISEAAQSIYINNPDSFVMNKFEQFCTEYLKNLRYISPTFEIKYLNDFVNSLKKFEIYKFSNVFIESAIMNIESFNNAISLNGVQNTELSNLISDLRVFLDSKESSDKVFFAEGYVTLNRKNLLTVNVQTNTHSNVLYLRKDYGQDYPELNSLSTGDKISCEVVNFKEIQKIQLVSKIQNKIQERILGVYFNQKTQDFVLYDLKTNWKFGGVKKENLENQLEVSLDELINATYLRFQLKAMIDFSDPYNINIVEGSLSTFYSLESKNLFQHLHRVLFHENIDIWKTYIEDALSNFSKLKNNTSYDAIAVRQDLAIIENMSVGMYKEKFRKIYPGKSIKITTEFIDYDNYIVTTRLIGLGQ